MSDRDEAGRFAAGNRASGGAGGRPTAYEESYCDEIIDVMADGYSVTAFAGMIRVSRSTVYKWADENPEFSDALEVAKAAAALWWENRLRDNAEKGEGNATAAIFGLKNRAADDWRDKREFNHESEGGTMTPKDEGSAIDRINSRLDSLFAARPESDDISGPE